MRALAGDARRFGGAAFVAGLTAFLMTDGGNAGPRAHAPGPDACLGCHTAITGLTDGHDPAQIGCSACHGGRSRAKAKDAAHTGLVRVPGNLTDLPRTCATAACHPGEGQRLPNALMTTMAGVVSVDRWVFGEAEKPSGTTGVEALGHSKADSHLRNLCASCHLGNPKTSWGPIGEASRGGGCNACHLEYSPEALASLERYRAAPRDGFRSAVHPAFGARVEETHCFGCHSRSGRISLNYRGWREAAGDGMPPPGTPTRTLEDGRVLYAAPADVHADAGMGCTDCHVKTEVMGDGRRLEHEEQQTLVRCDDCHRSALRGNEALRGQLTFGSGREALAHTQVIGGAAVVLPAGAPRALTIRPPATACTRGRAHASLACQTCHDAWAPTCLNCHTTYDARGRMFDLLANHQARGEWHETSGAMLAEPATLGVRESGARRRIQEFAPGMVITLERGDGAAPIFRRLFAPVFPHTVRREARACAGCHADPVALGFGRGKLEFHGQRWTFSPARALGPDGLPEDAWLGFLAARGAGSSTRVDARPFAPAEQRRILTVGTCLTCHDGKSAVMAAAEDDFAATLARRSKVCLVPLW